MMRVSDLLRVNGLAVGIGAVGLSLLVATSSRADVCTDPQTAVEYDSSNSAGDLPDETGDWSEDCFGADGNGYTVITAGVLIIDDNSTDFKAKYCAGDLFDDSCDPRQDAVYEFSCKAISVETNADAWLDDGALFVFSCGFSTGTDSAKDFDVRLAVTLDEGVGFFEIDGNGDASWLDIGGVLQHIDMAQTGDASTPWTQSHLFRVEKTGGFVKLFIDNNSTPSLIFSLKSLANNFLQDEMNLLSTSNPGKSEFELSLFRYRIASTDFDVPASNPCAGDIDGDDDVDVDDLLLLLAAWGPCVGCDEDINGDDVVSLPDLREVLATWGACP